MNRKVFFTEIRKTRFPMGLTQSQVNGLNAILDAFNKDDAFPDPAQAAYVLGSAYHETAKTMQPIEEIGKGRGHPYGQPNGLWQKCYYGRGYIQLTHLENYAKATTELRKLGCIGLDEDLAKNPEVALRSDIAAAVLTCGMKNGWFTGKKLSDYIDSSKSQKDYIGARRIVNGTDKAAMIAGYATDFERAILAAA
jgi:hypothetical protein